MRVIRTFKRLILVLCFICIFIMLFISIQNILRKKLSGNLDLIHSIYSLKENTVDVLFLGSSHAYYGLSPNVLWGEYGYSSAVIGSPSESMALSYYLLKDILHKQTPKVLVLETYGICYNKRYGDEGTLRNALDPVPLSLTKACAIWDLCQDMSLNQKLNMCFPISVYHERWGELERHDFSPSQIYFRGSKVCMDLRDFTEYGRVEYDEIRPSDAAVEYFERIIHLAEEHDVQVVLCALPMTSYDDRRYRNYRGKNMYLNRYALEHDIPFLFLEDADDYEVALDSHFLDNGHLNYWGQTAATNYIGAYLQEHYMLTDHRGDAAYKRYSDDYEHFISKIDEMLADIADGHNIKSVKDKTTITE